MSKKGKNFSCNNVSKKRKKSDFYETPYSMTRQFINGEYFNKELTVLEPSCGEGAILKILKENWKSDLVTGKDLIQTKDDYLNENKEWDYVITNPPFSLALEFIQKSKIVANKKFAMLLPLSYLHGKQRYDEVYTDKNYGLKNVHVFTRYPMLGDPLREDGRYRTGMMVYAWFVWENGYAGDPRLKWLDNHKYVLGARNIDHPKLF